MDGNCDFYNDDDMANTITLMLTMIVTVTVAQR